MKVYKECCKNCLLSPDRIVSAARAKDIIEDCKNSQSHFICHKASMEGKDVTCKTFYDKFGHYSQMVRIAERLGVVNFVEQPNSERLISDKELNKKPLD